MLTMHLILFAVTDMVAEVVKILQKQMIREMCILTIVDSDEPLQPPVKLRNSKSCLTIAEQSI